MSYCTVAVRGCFGAESEGMWGFGYAKFISLDELKDESKGYMSYDTLKVYVQFDVVRNF